jgi:4-oxalocrotonate tautomerase
MPFTTVKVIEGAFSKEQKAQLIEKITEAIIEVEGEGMRHFTWVVIEEVKQGDWGIGGKPVSLKAKPNSP